jgi:hypothetical protein
VDQWDHQVQLADKDHVVCVDRTAAVACQDVTDHQVRQAIWDHQARAVKMAQTATLGQKEMTGRNQSVLKDPKGRKEDQAYPVTRATAVQHHWLAHQAIVEQKDDRDCKDHQVQQVHKVMVETRDHKAKMHSTARVLIEVVDLINEHLINCALLLQLFYTTIMIRD